MLCVRCADVAICDTSWSILPIGMLDVHMMRYTAYRISAVYDYFVLHS
jgi:hypothetical protein